MNDKEKDCLEENFGIKKNARYIVHFTIKNGRLEDWCTKAISGKILNFCPSQLIIKSNDGLYIIEPCNITQMYPIIK